MEHKVGDLVLDAHSNANGRITYQLGMISKVRNNIHQYPYRTVYEVHWFDDTPRERNSYSQEVIGTYKELLKIYMGRMNYIF